ncbi:MAG: hypothetical protein HY906_25395 [Deltaproteobacteria bacterium]|nr:hypothetical protein [Deltaproteobacteria bacterium]
MRTTALFMVLALAAVGCNGSPDIGDDANADTIDAATKADGVIRPVGTYLRDNATAGQFTKVVLKTDRTFHRELMVYCIMAPCPTPATEGTYNFSKSGTTRYIRFLDENGDLIDRYAYKLDGDVLKLRASGSSSYVKYEHADNDAAWCGVADDCELQELPQPRCPGQWTCGAESTCAYDCRMPCEVAGGECVALYPGSCADGEVGDANTYSCGGGLGVMCCLPKQTQNECEAKGGSCVALTTTSCSDGIATGAEGYSCGGGLGVTCCLPYSACVPVCDAVGSRSEGWYNPCTGSLICWANCAGHTAQCSAVGSRSEGWYSTDNKGCNGGNLIGWANCAE